MIRGDFLTGITDAVNHRPLLWLALELTNISALPVIEFGAGIGSTTYLRRYCDWHGRRFYSYDSNEAWAEKWDSEFIADWLNPELYKDSSVVLIDQAPGEFRHESIKLLKDKALIIVVHDAEPEMDKSYQLSEIWHLFKYRIFTKGESAWTAAISNNIDLNSHAGEFIGDFKIEL